MATKIPAPSTVVKTQAATIERLEKELKTAKDDWRLKEYATAKAELESVHDILDAIPSAPEKMMSNGYGTRTLPARLAGYFALKA